MNNKPTVRTLLQLWMETHYAYVPCLIVTRPEVAPRTAAKLLGLPADEDISEGDFYVLPAKDDATVLALYTKLRDESLTAKRWDGHGINLDDGDDD